MSGTFTVTMGDRGRLVVPAELRDRAGLVEGTVIVLVETERGVVMATREQLKTLVRAALADSPSMDDELLADRRREAAADSVR